MGDLGVGVLDPSRYPLHVPLASAALTRREGGTDPPLLVIASLFPPPSLRSSDSLAQKFPDHSECQAATRVRRPHPLLPCPLAGSSWRSYLWWAVGGGSCFCRVIHCGRPTATHARTRTHTCTHAHTASSCPDGDGPASLSLPSAPSSRRVSAGSRTVSHQQPGQSRHYPAEGKSHTALSEV